MADSLLGYQMLYVLYVAYNSGSELDISEIQYSWQILTQIIYFLKLLKDKCCAA